MNNSMLWMRRMTSGGKLRVLDVMNNLGLYVTWATLGHVLRALVALNRSEL